VQRRGLRTTGFEQNLVALMLLVVFMVRDAEQNPPWPLSMKAVGNPEIRVA
jgi:hypothetical protein